MDDILGNGGGTPPPKGSKEWHEQQQDAPSVSSPAKGTQKWTEQQAAAAPAVTGSQSETVAAPPSKQADVNGGSLSYAELYKKLNPYKPPTDEELAKEKKKQKREQIFAAIGDGISALSNLFFTTQYAPNMYTGKNTMSERTKVRYDKLMKEREGKEKEYYEGLMRARIADEERDDRERKWQRQLGLDDYNRIRNDAKEERDRQMFELNLQLQGNKISASEAEAKRKGIEAKYAEELVKKMEKSGAKAYLVNTGWNGTGKRISIKDTRGIIDAILNGDILNAPTKKIPYFNFEVPTELPGVDSGILDPRDTYADASEWEAKAKDLAERFNKNFVKYTTNEAGKALVAAGPQL